MSKVVEFHPKAIVEARSTRRWYAKKSQAVGERFVIALDFAFSQISESPKLWPSYLHGTRVYRLRRFPYLVVYLELDESLLIVAVAHGSRRPGYWRNRVR